MSHHHPRPASPIDSDDLLHAVGSAVQSLLRSPDWESHLEQVLEQIARAVGASRCYLFEKRLVDTGDLVLYRRAEWEASDLATSPNPSESQSIVLGNGICDEWQARLDGGEMLVDINDLFPEAVSSAFMSRGVRSVAIVPVIVEETWWGCLGIDECEREREWSRSELDAFQVVADVLGTAIERQRLEHERVRVSTIVSNSDDAIIGKTLDGIVTEWNSGAESLYGYSAEEAIGQPITVIFPQDLQGEFETVMARLRQGERVEPFDTVRVRKDGREIAVSVSISPLRISAGEISGAVTIARDITERKQTELALRVSEERLRLALEAADVGAWDWYVETGEVVWSTNMEQLHGLEQGSFGGTFEDFVRGIHPDDHEMVTKRIFEALKDQDEYESEYRNLRPDGLTQWLETRGRVIRDDRGRPVRMSGICYDISVRKLVEQRQSRLLTELQSAHAEADAERTRLQELFQHAPAMMALLHGPEHVFTLANDRYLQAIGYREVVGKTVRDALPEVEDQGLIELLDQVLTTGTTVSRSELPVQIDVRGDGTLDQRYFSFAYQPVRDPAGEVTGVLVHAVDLTDHVAARRRVEELAEAAAIERDRLQQVIDVLPEGIAICDATGSIVLSNAAAREIWGQNPPAGDFREYGVFGALYPDGTPYPLSEIPLSRSVLRGEIVLGEQLLSVNRTRGESIPVLVNSAPIRDGDGAIVGGVAVFQDISKIKEFEQQKDEFLQTVSHDLKNPLTSIQGYSQLLRRIPPDDTDRIETAVGHMHAAARRAIVMLDEMLDLTRFQMGRPLELTYSEADLVELARVLVEQNQATTDRHRLQVVTELPRLVGEWDVVRLERVFGNLLANAILYSPDGGSVVVEISLTRTRSVEFAEISVRDEGIGIPAKDLAHLFERFWRGSNVREQFRGSGLGLPGAKAIVEAHGGDISVESVEGQGSTFTVRLPLRRENPPD